MANELIVIPRRLDQPIIGDKMQMQGSHVAAGIEQRLNADNAAVFTCPDGTAYIEIYAKSAIWYRLTPKGMTAANATVGQDNYLEAGGRHERCAEPGWTVKAIVDS
ncbi:hypothetical protein [Methylobacterium sp. 1030]|uniref:hypothetical protein n=1 Tax=Methylobacterium sp. 1030 TaxID=3156404 RepID=UPI00339A226A